MSYEEEQRVRQLIPERADFHLDNWGRFRRRYRCGIGHTHRSAVVSSSGMSSFEDLADEVDASAARVADAVIEGMSLDHRIMISQIYEAAVWTFRPGRERLLIAAAAEFWKQATKRGLL